MKKIKILGTGCPKCARTSALVEEVVKEQRVEAVVEKVEDIMEIIKYDVLATPAVVIDGEVSIAGRIPSKAELTELICR
jgi:small redox-active disulfide protein 2